MIVIADLWMCDKNHVPFNAAMVKILQGVFKTEKISFFGEKKHIDNIRSFIGSDGNISYHEVSQIKGGKIKHVIRELLALYNLLKLVAFCKKKNVKLLVLLYMYPPSHYIFELFRKYFFQNQKIIIVLHGEVGWINEKEVKHRKICGCLLKSALELKKKDKNLKYITLGEVIMQNIVLNMDIQKELLISIDHPYIYSPIPSRLPSFKPLSLASIGTADLTRNAHLIFEVGQKYKEYVDVGLLKLEIIGPMNPDIGKYANKYVAYCKTNEKLSRLEYENKIAEIDYVLFFRDNNQYTMRASGAFFDAIQFEKPIIAIKNDYFEYYFKRFGNIGYLCENIENLYRTIDYILKNKPLAEYHEQLNNIRRAKENLAITHIERDLKNKLVI
ncbi:hypothetical protein SAMN05660235_02521 [Sporolituus thermophilus DSM 23256]|uniref:Uncharacterized protein n=2 Tax=Sporolituus TaxID=909931 RepID=A0A1G7NCZ2_9FIRM|nr:hypothetical protein SAMN05660235_02521 [Sporolituus thermophilus DSM 23256]